MILLISGLICVALGFVFPKSKVVSVLIFAFIFIFYAFNYSNSDYESYYYNYIYYISKGVFSGFKSSEEGYVLLAYFSSKILHLDYSQFIILSSGICTILLFVLIPHLTDNYNMVYSFFILNPYWVMVCQTRFYFAFLMVIAGIVALVKVNGKKGVALFLLFIILAGAFHKTAFLCIIFVLAKLEYRYVMRFVMLFWCGSFAMLSSAGSKMLGKFFSEEKMGMYVSGSSRRSFIGVFSLFTVYFLIVMLAYMMLKYNKRHTHELRFWIKSNENERDELIFKVILLCLSFAVMIYINKNFERYARIMIVMNYIMIANHRKKVPKNKISIEQVMGYVSVILYYAYYYISFPTYFTKNLFLELENNAFVDFFFNNK